MPMLEFIALHFSSLLLPRLRHWLYIPFCIQKSAIGEHKDRSQKLRILWQERLRIPCFLQYQPVSGGGFWEKNSFIIFMEHLSLKGNSALFFLLLVQIVNVFMYLGTMSLTALNRPKDAFWITVIASIANILLDLTLIPILGITGSCSRNPYRHDIQCTWCHNSPFPYHSSKIRIQANKKYSLRCRFNGCFSPGYPFSPAAHSCNRSVSGGYHRSTNLPACFIKTGPGNA